MLTLHHLFYDFTRFQNVYHSIYSVELTCTYDYNRFLEHCNLSPTEQFLPNDLFRYYHPHRFPHLHHSLVLHLHVHNQINFITSTIITANKVILIIIHPFLQLKDTNLLLPVLHAYLHLTLLPSLANLFFPSHLPHFISNLLIVPLFAHYFHFLLLCVIYSFLPDDCFHDQCLG